PFPICPAARFSAGATVAEAGGRPIPADRKGPPAVPPRATALRVGTRVRLLRAEPLEQLLRLPEAGAGRGRRHSPAAHPPANTMSPRTIPRMYLRWYSRYWKCTVHCI